MQLLKKNHQKRKVDKCDDCLQDKIYKSQKNIDDKEYYFCCNKCAKNKSIANYHEYLMDVKQIYLQINKIQQQALNSDLFRLSTDMIEMQKKFDEIKKLLPICYEMPIIDFVLHSHRLNQIRPNQSSQDLDDKQKESLKRALRICKVEKKKQKYKLCIDQNEIEKNVIDLFQKYELIIQSMVSNLNEFKERMNVLFSEIKKANIAKIVKLQNPTFGSPHKISFINRQDNEILDSTYSRVQTGNLNNKSIDQPIFQSHRENTNTNNLQYASQYLSYQGESNPYLNQLSNNRILQGEQPSINKTSGTTSLLKSPFSLTEEQLNDFQENKNTQNHNSNCNRIIQTNIPCNYSANSDQESNSYNFMESPHKKRKTQKNINEDSDYNLDEEFKGNNNQTKERENNSNNDSQIGYSDSIVKFQMTHGTEYMNMDGPIIEELLKSQTTMNDDDHFFQSESKRLNQIFYDDFNAELSESKPNIHCDLSKKQEQFSQQVQEIMNISPLPVMNTPDKGFSQIQSSFSEIIDPFIVDEINNQQSQISSIPDGNTFNPSYPSLLIFQRPLCKKVECKENIYQEDNVDDKIQIENKSQLKPSQDMQCWESISLSQSQEESI